MKLFIGNLPSFYRIEQWNRISEKLSLLVILTDNLNLNDRNKDFYHGEMKFNHFFLNGFFFQKVLSLYRLVKRNNYSEFVIDGWDSPYSWIAAFLSPKNKNSCVIESTIYESSNKGTRGFLKRFFLSRMSKAYPCGKAHIELLKSLNYKGIICETGGCGILNYKEQPPFEKRNIVKNFLFVGRLVEVKNLKLLINVFNELPALNLTIVGFGEQECELKSIANSNICFLGAIDNKQLWRYYRETDCFILPSKSEVWGLVIEEALNNGTPVIVSNKVGCNKDLVTEDYGLIFDYDSSISLKNAIMKMTEIDFYNSLRKNISQLNFENRAQHQIDVFIS